jgi:hypothetical protein
VAREKVRTGFSRKKRAKSKKTAAFGDFNGIADRKGAETRSRRLE